MAVRALQGVLGNARAGFPRVSRYQRRDSSVSRRARAFSALSEAQVAHFREKGWVKVDPFWTSEELSALRSGLEGLKAAGRLANVSTEGDGKTKGEVRNLQLCPLIPEAKIFRAAPFQPKVSAAVRALLCDNDDQDVCCYLSQAFWKPPIKGIGTSWHQDNAYFSVSDGTKGTALWTAIHDATLENGTIHVAEGAHKRGVLPHKRDMDSDHHITCTEAVEGAEATPVELQAGGVVFFNFDMPHCTTANRTDASRAGIAYHFLRTDHYIDRQFPLPDDADWSAPLVAGPGATNGVAEFGEDCRDWA